MIPAEWKITGRETNEELVSGDGRWHISKTRKDGGECRFILMNYDLLPAPRGTGSDRKTCFRSFIADCARRIEKIRLVQREAEEYAAGLSGTAEEHADED